MKARLLRPWIPLVRAALLVISAPIVALAAVLGVGSVLPRIPRLGTLGSMGWPTYIGPGLLVSTVGTGLAAVATRLGSKRVGSALTMTGAAATVMAAMILSDQVRSARRAGAHVRPAVFSITPSPTARPDLTESYAEAPDGRPLRVDVYLPTAPSPAGSPIMVFVHGGGWIQGSTDEASADLRWFADQGYIVVSPEYTLATAEQPTWDIAMPQIATALAWAADRAVAWGGDPDRIVAWGGSAGANLALGATYAAAAGRLTSADGRRVPRVRAVAGEVPAVDPRWVYENRDAVWGKVTRGMVATYIGGPADQYPERLEAVRVNSYLTADAPPTLLTACSGDHLVPAGGVRQFEDEARRAGVEITVHYRRWGDHLISARFHGLPNQTMLRLYLTHFRAHGA
ncbi:alpha/beta hydrolase [Microbacterium sp. AZCO]|uniref:alpha/beta hydrolase n=1 Tax=Microbacterium sp. AZCO TaxID=3142976 RepID=UPI0031F3FC4F